jgi:hypothetical protein
MDQVQKTPHPPVDCATTDSGRQQLPTGHNAMLNLREVGQQHVHFASAAFASNIVVNAALAY